MSLSPARQHRLRVQAEQAAREGGSVRHASGYDLMLLQLAEDRRRLKGVQSTVKKAEIKVELLPKYAAWAEGVLAAGGAQQDDVLMYVMLWRIDAGDYVGARSKKGRIKRQMFAKLRTTKYLRTAASADSASVQFEGKVQRIARVHHYGLRDRVSPKGGVIKYPSRKLLGLNEHTENEVRDLLLKYLLMKN